MKQVNWPMLTSTKHTWTKLNNKQPPNLLISDYAKNIEKFLQLYSKHRPKYTKIKTTSLLLPSVLNQIIQHHSATAFLLLLLFYLFFTFFYFSCIFFSFSFLILFCFFSFKWVIKSLWKMLKLLMMWFKWTKKKFEIWSKIWNCFKLK